MAQKKSRQTFEKLKREQAVRERRALKQERRKAARLAKALGEGPIGPSAAEGGVEQPPQPRRMTQTHSNESPRSS
jgi:hypothetical protein